MLRLIGIVISIALADSINPTTIAPALYLAAGERAVGRVFEFTLGVFAVYFLGGAAIAVGAGQLVRPLIPHPGRGITYTVEVAAGAAMIVVAALLWRHRRRLAHRAPPDFDPQGRSSWILGASITAVELPTAFPYFAAIAAILGAGIGPVHKLFLLLLFNVCFVLPLLAIVAVLVFAGEEAGRVISSGRAFLQRNWPSVFAGLALLAGLFVVALGVSGLASGHSEFARDVHHTLRG